MAIEATAAIGAEGVAPPVRQLGMESAFQLATAEPAGGASFQSILSAGLNSVDRKIATANDLVRRFAVDDGVPVHQVAMALEEARLSVELAMQVRARLVEGYRELMNMQL